MSNQRMTPDEMVQNYLPDYERRKREFVNFHFHSVGLPACEGAARFDLEMFPEALTARDAELLNARREIMPREQFVKEVCEIARANLYVFNYRLGGTPEIHGYESLGVEAGDLYNRL